MAKDTTIDGKQPDDDKGGKTVKAAAKKAPAKKAPAKKKS